MATKIVKEINYLEYSERLKRLDLTTLEETSKREDLFISKGEYKFIK